MLSTSYLTTQDHPDGSPEHNQAPREFDAAELVLRIRGDQDSGLTELYLVFAENARRCFCRNLGPQDLEDRVHDAFLVVVRSIRHGELRHPERLLAFIHGIVRRQVATVVVQLVRQRSRSVDVGDLERMPSLVYDPEQRAAREERGQMMDDILSALAAREREILTRFYLEEQTQGQICGDMRLSETQFRLLKSRAKARFSELGKKRASPRKAWPSFAPAAQPMVDNRVRV